MTKDLNTIFPMKDNVLVTLADSNYIDQAKQLFSSVYWNSGWDGDYLLLSHNIPEDKLVWFRDKGIYIYECHPLGKGSVGNYSYHPSTVLSKFYLFDFYFKKWKKVVFLDADIIVRSSLEGLKDLDGFFARQDIHDFALDQQINYNYKSIDPSRFKVLMGQLQMNYNLESPAFNSGVMVINTNLIKADSLKEIQKLGNEYIKMSNAGEQLIMNLFMYGVWQKLQRGFNCYIPDTKQSNFFLKTSVITPVLHFIGPYKVWQTKNPFLSIWKSNLARANDINLANTPIVGVKISQEDICKSEEMILIRDRFLTEHMFSEPTFARQLDEYYALGMMKEFRHLFIWAIRKGYSRGYIRHAPYFFVSYIPPKLKTRIKNILFRMNP